MDPAGDTKTQKLMHVVSFDVFFMQISDDHRGGHGPATHGCGDSSCSVPRRAIVACCERQIGLCDLLIATIDKGVTCYGTLMEVGLAYSAGKVILIVFDGVRKDQRKELWFAAQMSLSSINSSNTAKAKAANAFEAVPYVKKRLGSLEQYLKQMQEVASGCKF
jgi:nucleoside 2-deoxyribosyltransferase